MKKQLISYTTVEHVRFCLTIGRSLKDTATDTGVSISTVSRIKKNPEKYLKRGEQAK